MADRFSTFQMRSLERAIFDARSTSDSSPLGAFSWAECWGVDQDGKRARSKGFGRPFLPCPRNGDFHSQGATREPITLLFPSVANDNSRRLFLGTKTRLAVLDEAAGDFTIFPSTFGADGETSLTQRRFHLSELQNEVIATNGFDLVQHHTIGSATVQPIPGLVGAGEDENGSPVDVMSAEVIVSWQGFMFLMNTMEGTERFASRIRWSDLNRPLLWIADAAFPGSGIASVAAFQDLPYSENILAAIPFGGSLYVFTDKSIWKCSLTINTAALTPPEVVTLTCNSIYTEPENQAKCLAYRNAIGNDGTAFWYAGRDGIYRFKPGYTAEPERVEWLHRSTKMIFPSTEMIAGDKQIDQRACQSPVMKFFPATDELHFSWPVTPVDVTPAPDCEDYEAAPPTPGPGLNAHTLVANTKFETADYRPYGATTYANFRSDTAAQGDCNQEILRLFASARDYTIKQMDNRNGWEVYSPGTDNYSLEGYYSILRGVFPFEKFDADKLLKSFLAELTPDDPLDTALIACRIGVSYESLDPNAANGRCEVLWKPMTSKPIKCRNNFTAAEYIQKAIQPYAPVKWSFLHRARFLYFELKITSAAGVEPIAGGCSVSRFEVCGKLS